MSKVLPVPLDLLDPPEQMEQLVLLDLLAPPAQQAPQGQLDRQELQDQPVRKGLPVRLDPAEQMEQLVLRDLLAPLVRQAPPERPDR
jgi:hypothetical protein